MPDLTLHFDDDDATLERLTAKAQEHAMSPEQWVRRVIARELGDFALKDLPEGFEPQNLSQLFAATGITKPKT